MKRYLLVKTLVGVALFLGLACSVQAADKILQTSEVTGGFVVHLGCGDGKLTPELKKSDAYIVHGLDTDPDKVQEARVRFLAGKFNGTISAATFDGEHLPYVDNLVNLLVLNSRFNVSPTELMRVLTPNGVLLEQTAKGWEKTGKPVPAEMDQWTHYLHDADNNAVSKDTAIAAPLGHLQWKGGPRYSRHHDKSSSVPAVVTADGKLFYIVDEGPRASILWTPRWQLTARDAFNGVILWRKDIDRWTSHLWPLKSGPSVTPRRLVALRRPPASSLQPPAYPRLAHLPRQRGTKRLDRRVGGNRSESRVAGGHRRSTISTGGRRLHALCRGR